MRMRSVLTTATIMAMLTFAGIAAIKHGFRRELTAQFDPIVLDLDGDTFQSNFTDADHGIRWDFFGRGKSGFFGADEGPIQLAWSKPGKRVGFLWIDRNTGDDRSACFMASDQQGCNGIPDNGKELFTDVAPQMGVAGFKTSAAHPYRPTGFGALKMFDKSEYGGNGDGRIDANDRVFEHLHVWVDLNHNGKLDPGENFSLKELGVVWISLEFRENNERDQYRNTRWLDGTVVTNNSHTIAIYDVAFREHD